MTTATAKPYGRSRISQMDLNNMTPTVQKALSQKPTTPAHLHTTKPLDRANLDMLPKKNGKILPWKARVKHPDEARPPEQDLFMRPVYKTGMGDCTPVNHRPGSSDHAKWASFGSKT